MNVHIEKLNLVSLLLEIDNQNSTYNSGELNQELKRREPTKKELEKAIAQKTYVQQQRQQKAEEPLSLGYKLLLILSPFSGLGKTNMDLANPPIDGEEAFLTQAGYQKKTQEIKKYRKIGIVIWVTIFVTINIYVLITR